MPTCNMLLVWFLHQTRTSARHRGSILASSNWSIKHNDEFAANERACITVHAAAIGKIKIIALARADMNKINTDTVTLSMSPRHVFHPSTVGAIEIQSQLCGASF